MYSPSEVMVGDSCIWILDEDSESNEWIVNNDLVLMQSTGLTDSAEKEIFEGDIVKVTDGDERTNFPDGGIGTICGLDEIFMWYIDGQVHNGLFDISQEYYIEVIGNIYENQELLEVSS
nr:MAG: YopX protein [Bacteriophage sp.]